jgi:hypothetical protein
MEHDHHDHRPGDANNGNMSSEPWRATAGNGWQEGGRYRVWIWRMYYRRWSWPWTADTPDYTKDGLAEERRAFLFFILAMAYFAVVLIVLVIHAFRPTTPSDINGDRICVHVNDVACLVPPRHTRRPFHWHWP